MDTKIELPITWPSNDNIMHSSSSSSSAAAAEPQRSSCSSSTIETTLEPMGSGGVCGGELAMLSHQVDQNTVKP